MPRRWLAIGCATIAACTSTRSGWRLEHPDSLEPDAARVSGLKCPDQPGPRGRAACYPFPCELELCQVKRCRSGADCGYLVPLCDQGFCVEPPLQDGRDCEPFDGDELRRLYPLSGGPNEPLGLREAALGFGALTASRPAAWLPDEARDYVESFDGCACRPQDVSSAYSSSGECGPFPCTAQGCYVSECASDSDCKYGYCSSHASYPNGYCVNSDPY